ncbi:DNA repair protein RecO [Thiomicrorhabdus cannonii]|uniref:DNA repair protein RecO n=1 Tax=Thiomicrorhabdus cannonii TaxID=2748011 RepID=UPI0015B89184
MEIRQPAYVLHRRAYRETSLLVTLLTPEHGKINAVVRGVRGKTRSALQKNAVLQPFQKLQIQWKEKAHTTSDLVTLSLFEPEPLRFPLEGEASFCGLYMNELLYRLLYHGAAVEELFADYEQALFALLKTHNRSEQAWVLRQFESALLQALGVELNGVDDAHHQPLQAAQDYLYYPEMGAYPYQEGMQQGGVLISGACLQALAERRFCEACLPQWKVLLRQILSVYLGNKPILARQLFK